MFDRIREYLQTHFTRGDAARLVSSLILATMLWGYVSLITDPEQTQSFAGLELAPIDDLDDDLILTSSLQSITVRLTGPESVLEDISPSEIEVSLDLDDLDGPDDNYQARVRIDTPDGVRRSVADPPFVPISVAEFADPVEFALTPRPVDVPENVSIRIDPAQPEVSVVRVSGAVPVVERVATVELPIQIGSQTQTFTEDFAPVALDALGNPVPEAIIEPATVTTTVPVFQRGQTVPVFVRLSGSPEIGFFVTEQRTIPQSAVLDGPQDLLQSVVYVYTEAVDIAGASDTVATNVPIDVSSLPEGVTVLTPASNEVEVIVAISPPTSPPQSLPGQIVQVVGLEPGFTAVAAPSEISVVVETSAQQIEQLQAGDIVVSVEVAGLGPGTHRVRPSVSVPREMSWIRTDPELVSVTISESDAFNGDALPGLGDVDAPDEAGISPEASPVQSPVP